MDVLAASVKTLFRQCGEDAKVRCKRNMIRDLWAIGGALLHLDHESPTLGLFFVDAANRFSKGITYSGSTASELSAKKMVNYEKYMKAYAVMSLSISETQVLRRLITMDRTEVKYNREGDSSLLFQHNSRVNCHMSS
jgi:hypothetical protein